MKPTNEITINNIVSISFIQQLRFKNDKTDNHKMKKTKNKQYTHFFIKHFTDNLCYDNASSCYLGGCAAVSAFFTRLKTVNIISVTK